jgi:fused signal recognition particle receptor
LFKGFTNKIGNIFSSKRIDENSLTELEELLLTADVGIETADKIINKLRNEKFSVNFDINEIKSKLSKIILDIIEPYQGYLPNIDNNKPTIILCIGVNGSGKTTTIAKLAHHYNNMNYKIILGAADTFRAAATEQLSEWSKELGLEIITGIHNSDPASIAYKCVENTLNNDFDIGIIDTAGRLQNRSDLMEQLKKIYKVIESKNNYLNQKTIMIIDGTTGQSSIKQVEEFSKYAKIDGLILSKLDGSAVGGTIISIIDHLKVPVLGIGIGENKSDLEEFNAKKFIDRILKN